jgi:murein DD-endopeptidase MepM/ murein hydrolase activator NlpD
MVSVPVAGSMLSASATENVESLKERLASLEQKEKEYQKVLETAESDIANSEEYNTALVSKITTLNEKIDVNRETIDTLNKNIAANQKLIDAANESIEEQLTALCERLRAIYMAGSASDLEIILGAKDFSDMIDKITLVKNLSKYDKELIDQVNVKLDEINAKNEEQKKNKAELESTQTALNEDLAELNTTLEQNKEKLSKLQLTAEQAKEFMKNAGDQQAQVQAEINRYFNEQEEAARQAAIAKRKAQEAQQKQNSSSSSSSSSSTEQSSQQESESQSGGEAPGDPEPYVPAPVVPSSGYTWPAPGVFYISSYFGDSEGRGYGHGGLDIAGDYNTPIVAADDGVVAYTYSSCIHNWGKDMSYSCGCGGGYGNYVWIDHGNGKESIYGHLGSLVVHDGEKVTKGQLIGYMGSTGHSTGSHLHFECRYNGDRYDPLDEF